MQRKIEQVQKELAEVTKWKDGLNAENNLLKDTLQSAQASNRKLQTSLNEQKQEHQNQSCCSQAGSCT